MRYTGLPLARGDVTTMHRAATARDREPRIRARFSQKNPINCFYGDKFPPGGARFFSLGLCDRAPAQPRYSARGKAHRTPLC